MALDFPFQRSKARPPKNHCRQGRVHSYIHVCVRVRRRKDRFQAVEALYNKHIRPVRALQDILSILKE